MLVLTIPHSLTVFYSVHVGDMGWGKIKLQAWTHIVDRLFSSFLTSLSPFALSLSISQSFFQSVFALSLVVIIFILIAILIFVSSIFTSPLPLLCSSFLLLSLSEWVAGRFKGDLVAFYSVILRFLIKEHGKSPYCIFFHILHALFSLLCLWRLHQTKNLAAKVKDL